LQPGDGLLELRHQEMFAKAALDRIDDAGEIPELTLGARVERLPHGIGVLCRIEIAQQGEKIVEYVCGLDEDGVSRHAFDVVDLFLFADIPGVDLIELAPLVLGDLEDQRQDLLTEGGANALAAVRIGDILQIVVEDGSRQDLVANPEPGEDAHGSHQVGDIGDPIGKKITAGAPAVLLSRVLSELVIVAAGGKSHCGLEHRGE
jgi:hypothetical protein